MKIYIIAIVLLLATGISAQTVPDVQNQIKQLEGQLKALQDEIEKLKKATQPAVEKTESTPAATTAKKSETEPKATGIDLGNGVRAVPYGSIYFNLFANDAATNNSDIPLFALQNGKGNTGASVRQTRFGLRIEGVKVGKAKLTGIIETDFFGGSPGIGIGENFGVVRVRLANVKLDWQQTAVTIGQDWMPFAPQNPTSIANGAIPQFAAAGNNWARLPQVKLESRTKNGKVVWQGAVLAPQTGDSSAAGSFLLQPNSGSLSRLPFFQTRLAFVSKNWLSTKKTGTVGISGHYGRARANSTSAPIAESSLNTFGVALDWNLPLHKRFVWVGEVFLGENLAGFQGGVFQGLNTDYAVVRNGTLVANGVKAIRTAGGWTQVGFTPDWIDDKLTFYGSIGLDDPRNSDLANIRLRDFRTRNFALAFDAIYKVTPQFQIGVELRRLDTRYAITGQKRANHLNLGALYNF